MKLFQGMVSQTQAMLTVFVVPETGYTFFGPLSTCVVFIKGCLLMLWSIGVLETGLDLPEKGQHLLTVC